MWVSTQANPLRDKKGEIRGSVVTFHDITTKKEADAQLKILTNAVEQTADSIIITDRGGLIEYVNPAFETTTGYTREELRGITPRILKSGVHDDSFYEKLWATILAGNVYRGTIANRKKIGRNFLRGTDDHAHVGPNGEHHALRDRHQRRHRIEKAAGPTDPDEPRASRTTAVLRNAPAANRRV